MEKNNKEYLHTIPVVPFHEDNFIVRSKCNDEIYSDKDKLSEIAEGEIIEFGEFIQESKEFNSKISWIVIRKEASRIYLISEKALAYKAYDDYGYYADTSWKECELRKWVNTVFINNAFNDYERRSLVNVNTSKKITDEKNIGSINGTFDKVFVLNKYECQKLLDDESKRCKGTNYAMCQDEDNWYSDEPVKCNYWLRTESRGRDVTLWPSGKEEPCTASYYVRPVICISLNNKYFGGKYDSWEDELQGELNSNLEILREKYSKQAKNAVYKKLKEDNISLTDFFNKLEADYYNIGISSISELKDYFVSMGIMSSTTNLDVDDLIGKIKMHYHCLPKPKSMSEIENALPELKTEIRLFQDSCKKLYGVDATDYLRKVGVFQTYEEKRAAKEENGLFVRKTENMPEGTVSKGRPISVDPDEITKILFDKVKERGPYLSLGEIKEDNPELKGKLKTLSNISGDLLGTSLGKYLKEKGIISK